MDKATLQIRRQALEDAIAIAESSWTAHNNGTGHYRAAWIKARKDIIQKLRERIEQERAAPEYGMPMIKPRLAYAE